VIEGPELGCRRRVVAAALDGQHPLRRGRHQYRRVERAGDRAKHHQPGQAGHGQDEGVGLALSELAEPGVDVAAHRHDPRLAPGGAQQGRPPGGPGPDSRSAGQHVQAGPARPDQRLARVLPGRERRDSQSRYGPGRQVLAGVHDEVDVAAQQRLAQGAGEHPGSAEPFDRRGRAVTRRATVIRTAGRPQRSRSRRATWPAWASASGLPRVPSRNARWLLGTVACAVASVMCARPRPGRKAGAAPQGKRARPGRR
jgi:hypothetical protein